MKQMIWFLVGVILLLVACCLVLFGRRLRDFFIRKGRWYQFVWLLSVIISVWFTFFCFAHLGGLMPKWEKAKDVPGLIVHFIGTGHVEEELNVKVTTGNKNTEEAAPVDHHDLCHIHNPSLTSNSQTGHPIVQNEEAKDQKWLNFIFTSLLSLTGMILLSGLLVSTITNMVNRRLDLIEKGWVFYKYKKHNVFIGYDDTVIGLIRQIENKIVFGRQKSRQEDCFSRLLRLFCEMYYGNGYYIVVSAEPAQKIWQELRGRLEGTICDKILVIQGKTYSAKLLKELNLNLAKYIFIIGDSSEKGDCDSINLKCYRKIHNILIGYKQRSFFQKHFCISTHKKSNSNDILPELHLMFKYQSTFSLYQRGNYELISKEQNDNKRSEPEASILDKPIADERDTTEKGKSNNLVYYNYYPFNFHEMWSQKVFVGSFDQKPSCEQITYKPLDYEPLPAESENYVHLVVVGMTSMGIAIAIQAARLGHYANYKKNKTRITFIDANMDIQKNIFVSRYNEFYNAVDKVATKDYDQPLEVERTRGECSSCTDIELEFVDGRVETPKIRKLLTAWANDPNRLLTVAVCFLDPAKAMATALYLPNDLFLKQHNDSFERSIPILVNQRIPFNSLLHNSSKEQDNNKGEQNVYPFGMIEDCYDLDLNNQTISKLVNYLYDKATEYGTKEHSLTAVAETELNNKWNSLSLINKWSNRYFVDHMSTKFRILGRSMDDDSDITSEQLGLLAEVEHNRWVTERLLLGFGPATPEEKKKIRSIKSRLEEAKKKCPSELDSAEVKRLADEKSKTKKFIENVNHRHVCIDDLENLLHGDQVYDKFLCRHM